MTRHRCEQSGQIHGHAVPPIGGGTWPWEIRIYGTNGDLLTKGTVQSQEAAGKAITTTVAGIQEVLDSAERPMTTEQQQRLDEQVELQRQNEERVMAAIRADEAAWAEHLRKLAEVEGRTDD